MKKDIEIPIGESQHELMDRLGFFIMNEAGVVFSAIVGSRAQGDFDFLSDWDFVLICKKCNISSVKERSIRILSFSCAALEVLDKGQDYKSIFYIGEDFKFIEIHLVSENRGFDLHEPCETLKNEIGKEVSTKNKVHPMYYPAMENGRKSLAWDLFWCFKWAIRGESTLAEAHLLKMATFLVQDK